MGRGMPCWQRSLEGNSVSPLLTEVLRNGTPPARQARVAGKLTALSRRVAGAFKSRVEDTDFMRESSAAMLEGPRRFAHWILWATLLFLGAALIWASLATVDEVTVGEGKVIPSSRVQVVQNLEGGIVSEIFVQVGQLVQRDQALMRIDDTRFTASSREGRAKDQALIARIARLAAEAGNTAYLPPRELERENPKLVAEEKSLYLSRQRELQANLSILRQQAEQRRQELAEKRAREEQLQQRHGLDVQELTMTRPLPQRGEVSEVGVLRR